MNLERQFQGSHCWDTTLVLLLAYPLTKKRVEENAAVLRERRGEAAQEP